jgi:uncharacterized protein YbjT (DUF2867 family)
VTGATGFVGRRLVEALIAEGVQVRAMTRHPAGYVGAGTPVYGDVHDPGSLATALDGCSVAYYLVHSLGSADFARLDADAARNFGLVARGASVSRIVYLGGLGSDEDQLSEHLRSRRLVESLLGEAGVPVTVLRAGMVVGHGGLSWEITRQLVDRLPVMVTPRWVATRTQPIAVDDVIGYLVGVLDHPEVSDKTYEIGGPEVLRYADLLRRVAVIRGRPLAILPVPWLSPGLSSRWLALVTDVDTTAGRHLVDSMTNEVVVRNHRIRELLPRRLIGFDQAARRALADLKVSR